MEECLRSLLPCAVSSVRPWSSFEMAGGRQKVFCGIFFRFLKEIFLIFLVICWWQIGREKVFASSLVSEIYSDFFSQERFERHMLGEHEVKTLNSPISPSTLWRKFECSVWSSLSRQKVGKKNMNFLLAMHFTKDMERTVRFHFWQIWILNNIFAK